MMVRDGAAGAGSAGRMPTSMTTLPGPADETEAPAEGGEGGGQGAEGR